MAERPKFARFLARAGTIAALTVALGLALIAIGVSLGEGFAKTLVLTVATAILSTGGVSFLYEVYLRRELTEDVLEMVKLERGLVEVGIRSIGKRTSVHWADFFDGAERVRMLPINPTAWYQDEWPHAVDARLHRTPSVEVYLPNPEGDVLPLLAARLGRDPVELKAGLQRLLRDVERGCRELHARLGGTYAVFTYDGAPGLGVATADKRLAIALPRPLEVPDGARVLALLFEAEEGGLMATWVQDQFDNLPDIGTDFRLP